MRTAVLNDAMNCSSVSAIKSLCPAGIHAQWQQSQNDPEEAHARLTIDTTFPLARHQSAIHRAMACRYDPPHFDDSRVQVIAVSEQVEANRVRAEEFNAPERY